MTLSEAITAAGYRDSHGFVTPRVCAPTAVNGSGNGLMYSSEEILLAYELGELTQDMCERWVALVRSCERGAPGCYARGPLHPDTNTSFDDYILVAAAARVACPAIARDIFWYGLKHFGVYNNEPLTWDRLKRQWLWRNPQFIAHLVFACGWRPIWLLRKAWMIGVRGCMSSPDADGWAKTWAMVVTARGLDDACDAVAAEWLKLAREKKPNILAQTLEPAHPLARAFTC